jgi:hypothetical protein
MDELNQYLQPKDSPIGQRPPTFYLDSLAQIQTNYIKASQVALTKFASLSNVSSAQTESPLEQNQSVTLTVSLDPLNAAQGFLNLALPYVTAYEGTAAVGTAKIWPSQGDTSFIGRYKFLSGLDYSAYNGTNSVFKLTVERSAAGSAHIYFDTQWKFFDSSTEQR